MGFNIRFLPQTVDGSELGNTGRLGEIELGAEREGFVSLIGFWSPKDYEDQWIAAVQRLVKDRCSSCLITSIHEPKETDAIIWWLLYPYSQDVRVQNALLLTAEQTLPFSTSDPYQSIPPYRAVTDEGDMISEWRLHLSAFEDFLRSHGL
jgi:hypothetical protein